MYVFKFFFKNDYYRGYDFLLGTPIQQLENQNYFRDWKKHISAYNRRLPFLRHFLVLLHVVQTKIDFLSN